jgi:CRAL/TRIO domain
MKGCAVAIAIANPIAPVHPQDDRPSVKELIDENRELIGSVVRELSADPLYDANKHDDLWVVRFLLSHKQQVKPSVKAAKHTLAFRAEHKLDERDIRYFPFDTECPNENAKRYRKYVSADTSRNVIPDPQRGMIGIYNMAGIDQPGLVANVDESDWLPIVIYLSEWEHQWVDYITRTTGRLTKVVRILDAAGLSLARSRLEVFKRDGRAMGVVEECYPQKLQTVFICHAPACIQVPWRILRPMLPKRVVEKIDFMAPEKREKERGRLLRYISEEHLPVRFGGKNDVWPVDFPPPPPMPPSTIG